MDLLDENNECGRALLTLTSRGNYILYELFSLKDAVPSIYSLNPSRGEVSQYGLLLNLDFQYFQSTKKMEDLIRSNENLCDLDDSLKESYSKILTRFYKFFDSIISYTLDLKKFISDCGNGVYLQVCLDSLMTDPDGKQLLCEALNLLGVVLLLTDKLFPGPIRERLLVAYNRYTGGHTDRIDDVCKLLRSTGFVYQAGKRPPDYPECFFKRTNIPESFIRIVISRLRLDDIYNQMSSFPEHRSLALSSQGSMMIICLFFAPHILKEDKLAMREIVDKFFFDSWVTTYYMGNIINLVHYWEPYPAAKSALSNTIQTHLIREITKSMSESLKKLVSKSTELLNDGVLTEEELMDKSVQILDMIRKCNYALRWIMLHTSPLPLNPTKKSRQLRDDIMLEFEGKKYDTFILLLNTASLELKIRRIHQDLISKREEKWTFCQNECESRMLELSKVFAGELKLSRVSKNTNLEKWFYNRKKEISNLNLEDPLKSGRIAMKLIRALKESTELGQMDSNLQVKQYVMDSIEYLTQIVRYAGVKEEFLVLLQVISDFQYGWEIIDHFTPLIQEEVINDPSIVKRLQAIFIKISSVIETPILRISQIESKQLTLVSNYYSVEIVQFIQNVLQIIPKSIFELLIKVLEIQSVQEFDMPSRLDKDQIKSYALLDERYEIAKLTHDISTFADGMMTMNNSLIGVIRINAKNLLIEGMRKELVQRVCFFCNKLFSSCNKSKSLNSRLIDKIQELKTFIQGMSKSFEYVQDYINIPGLCIWQEEMSRIINFYVEQESNLFLKHKIPQVESAYQSKTIPIILYPSLEDGKGLTFVGYLAQELLNLIDPFQIVFVNGKQKWYDVKSKTDICSLSLFSSLFSALGSYGMAGLDRLIGLKAVVCLQNLISHLIKNNPCSKEWSLLLKQLDELNHMHKSHDFIRLSKTLLTSKASKSLLSTFLHFFCNMGSFQILRLQISYQLKLKCNFNSKPLYSAVKNLNESLLEEEKRRMIEEASSSVKSKLPSQSNLLQQFSHYLQWSGLLDPLKAIYMIPDQINLLPEFIFLLIISVSSRLSFIDRVGNSPIIRKPGDHIDGNTLVLGISCFLNQFPIELSRKVFLYLGNYLTSVISITGQVNQDALTIKVVLQLLIRQSRLANKIMITPAALTEHCLFKL
uniref:Uncharacterized protein n=1 Tax=Lepeophtheirus salmonis TaxID=72036 RepID=A0A0K2UPG6_LEPSM